MRRLSINVRAKRSRASISRLPIFLLQGRVSAVSGLAIDIAGMGRHLSIGDRVEIASRGSPTVAAEVVGFKDGRVQAMPFGALSQVGPSSRAFAGLYYAKGLAPALGGAGALHVSDSWIGRVIDPLGEPLDGLGPLPRGEIARRVRADPPAATARGRLGVRLDLGIRALNCFTTCRKGQRLGLFAGSGVGKSTLLAMMAKGSGADVTVLALVGERGREVRDFLEDELGDVGLARTVVVVATSDAPPLLRREAAYAAMTVAEHFRDKGKSVLLLMDSVTRFCMALREIGLSAGEPPATRGYPPSVFAELPRLLERAGPGIAMAKDAEPGFITALFTVLVEGDDLNEPVADAARGILDGHVVLDRRIAEAGRYPAIDVLRSLSRAVPGCNLPDENDLTRRARAILALHGDMAELIRLGAYRAGTDPAVDEAIAIAPRIESMLKQRRDEWEPASPPDLPTASGIEHAFTRLKLAMTPPADA